jgi:hypothetical protein
MDGSPAPGFRQRPWWLLALVVVAVGQFGLARNLFGPEARATLTDPRPVVSGRHPLHLYHGALGAGTFRDRSATACYDPHFQAGYPKTPVFDGGSRPAELVLALAGGGLDPAAYKQGLLALCLFAPACFAVAARGLGLSPPGVVLAAVGSGLVWWSSPVRGLLDEGNVDVLVAGLMGLVFVGGLCRYATEPGPTSWLWLVGSSAAGWYAHPVAWLGLAPVVAAYYVAVAPRQGLAWHLGLGGAIIGGLAPNLWWLADWVKFWWLRQPSVEDLSPLSASSSVIGLPGDYVEMLGPGVLGWGVLAVGVGGLIGMARAGLRVPAGVALAAVIVAVVATRLGQTWPTLQLVTAGRTAPFAVAVLVLPGAWLFARWWETSRTGVAVILSSAGLWLFAGLVPVVAAPLAAGFDLRLAPLRIGLAPEQEQLVAALKAHTTPDARILIEESEPDRPGWNWTALLPALTDRVYLGGLDPAACVEHAFCGLRAGRLNGRPFAEWTTAERAEFCRRYNVGWVVCRTAAAADWWASDPAAREVGRYQDGGRLVLFALDRQPSYVLAGSGRLESADRRRIVFTDVVPNEFGEAVLSFHHQPGLRVAPTGVWLEGDKDLFDPIPMIKLRLSGPVSRVVLTWE